MTSDAAEPTPFPAHPAINDVARAIAHATSLREAVEALQAHGLWTTDEIKFDGFNQDIWDPTAFSCLVSIAGLGPETLATAFALAASYRARLELLYAPARYPTSIIVRVVDGPRYVPVLELEQVLWFSEPDTAEKLGIVLVCVERTRVELRVPLVWSACWNLRPLTWETPRPALRDVVRAVGTATTLPDATSALRARGLWPSDAPPVRDIEALIAVASLGVPTVLALRALAREAARESAVAAGVRTSPDTWSEFPWKSWSGRVTREEVGDGLAANAAAKLCGAVILCGVMEPWDVGYGAAVPRVPRTELADAREGFAGPLRTIEHEPPHSRH